MWQQVRAVLGRNVDHILILYMLGKVAQQRKPLGGAVMARRNWGFEFGSGSSRNGESGVKYLTIALTTRRNAEELKKQKKSIGGRTVFCKDPERVYALLASVKAAELVAVVLDELGENPMLLLDKNQKPVK